MIQLKNRRLEECWSGLEVPEQWKEQGANMLVSLHPSLFADPVAVAYSLLHVSVHAEGIEGHRSKFSQRAAELGLREPWVVATPTSELQVQLTEMLAGLPDMPKGSGDFPYPKLKKQAVRQLKMECRCEPPRIIRAAQAVIDLGPIYCTLCESVFEQEEKGGDDEQLL